jgi:hypothetical protein
VQKPTMMTLSQGLLFLVYYTVFQAILVAVAAFVFGPTIGWKGVLSALGLLASCGPVFLGLIYWFRASLDHPGAFAIRFGVSMTAMVICYGSAVTFGARSLGLSLVPPAALPDYFGTAILFGTPVFSLTAYLLSRRRIDYRGHQSP